MPNTERTWDGGYIRTDAKGRDVYVIRRMVAGRRYDVSTRAHSSRAADKQLARFEADPAGYTPGGDEKPAGAPIYLDEVLSEAFLTFSREVKKNSLLWVNKQCDYLAWWAERLQGINLKKVSLVDHIKPALVGAKAEGHRIAVLKALYSYLRKETHALSVAEDPTFGALRVPQSDPNARLMKDKAISKKDFLKTRAKLDAHWRAAIDIQAGTGWHLTELKRFAGGGLIESHPHKVRGVAGVLVCPETKSGGMLKTPVGKEVLVAADLILERGTFSIEKYGMAVKAASEAAGISPPITPGRMRHSVATWAINAGTDPAVVAAFLNHKSPRTTRRFYATHAVPRKIPTLR